MAVFALIAPADAPLLEAAVLSSFPGENYEISPGQYGAPPDRPVGAPVRELFPAMDARFVLVEIGKLTTKVDRLVDDVGSLGKKVAEVQHQVSFVRGAAWVIPGIVSLSGILLTLIASGKLKISLG